MRHQKKRAFLTAFRETGNVRLAGEAATVARATHYRWLADDPEYRDAFDAARMDAAELLEAEARRRAVDGWEEPAGWYRGKPGGVVRRYSDTLLIFLLKGLKPDVYREHVELRGSLAQLDFSVMPAAFVSRVAAGEHPLAALLATVAEITDESEVSAATDRMALVQGTKSNSTS